MLETNAASRRHFLKAGVGVGAVLASGSASQSPDRQDAARARTGPLDDDWAAVRAQFNLSPDWVHLGGFLLASHPAPVREAIERHRRGLDENPVHYLDGSGRFENATLRAAADYMGVQAGEIALTDSTTMGLGLLYNGLALRPGQEVLTTQQDYYATHEALRLRAARGDGVSVRTVSLHAPGLSAGVSQEELVELVVGAVSARTRVVALTWVHSSTGLKLPIRAIADALADLNASRAWEDRALLCVDGVHGFGVEDVTLPELGADFFAAGCHKWLFGPRGTGVLWGRERAWPALRPTIPSFSGNATPAAATTPGGFHSFEHRWALAEAFAFHLQIGKARVAERVHALNRQFKEGLSALRGVEVYTPRDDALSAGLVCFDVRGLAPTAVVGRLRARGIIATVTPYATSYARVAPGLLNTPEEVDMALGEVRALA